MIRFIISLLVLLTTIGASAVYAEPLSGSREEILAVADPILENILAGFENNDYGLYARDFDVLLRESLPESKFRLTDQQLEKSLGHFKEKEYLGFLQQAQMTVVLWKGRFSLTDGDILIKLVLSQRPDKVVVTGLWFQ